MRLGDLDALKATINNVVDEEIEIDEKWAKGLKYSLKIIDNAPTVEINTNDIEYRAYCKGLEDGKKIAKPQGKWICPNCDFYDHVEDDYCQYAGECTIGCRECKYFKQKGSAE